MKTPQKNAAKTAAPAQKTPWFEGTLLWGAFGVAISLILVVLATVLRNIRLLLFAACPFLWLTIVFAFKSFSPAKAKVVLLVLVCLQIAGGSWVLYMALEPRSFTAQQKKDFTAILKSAIAAPDWTLLSCPDTDEDACVYATEFIPLFQRAGWKVEGPAVERVKLAQPTRNIVIVIHGPPLVHPQNPDEGVWTERPIMEQPVKTAFEFLGFRPLDWNDPSLPVGKIRVYFGSSPYTTAR